MEIFFSLVSLVCLFKIFSLIIFIVKCKHFFHWKTNCSEDVCASVCVGWFDLFSFNDNSMNGLLKRDMLVCLQLIVDCKRGVFIVCVCVLDNDSNA